ncbi:MAG TPA: RecX family transcriptional regulator [Spirochaetia bacterium]|nr:RecX family transcriptional regulator [Spirochaetia bacterium]
MPRAESPSETRSSLIKYAAFCLSRRPYFEEIIRQKLVLRAKKLNISDPSDIILDILKDLKKSGYLDDRYLAQAYARRQLNKCYGPRVISLKLSRLKISKETIGFALEEADTQKQLEAVQRFSLKNHKLDKYKLISKLYARGFGSSVINKLFDVEYLED